MLNLRKGLVEDVRRKIEREELQVSGVMTFPHRAREREPIPSLWASDFFFEVDAGKVSVVQFGHATHTYAAVIVAGAAASKTAQPVPPDAPNGEALVLHGSGGNRHSRDAAAGVEAEAPQTEPEPNEGRARVSAGPARTRGSRFPRAELVAIARARLETRKRLNKDEARFLLAEFTRLHPGRRSPAYREVLDHVRSIYDEAAKSSAPRFPPD